jgi:hypothetical protein
MNDDFDYMKIIQLIRPKLQSTRWNRQWENIYANFQCWTGKFGVHFILYKIFGIMFLAELNQFEMFSELSKAQMN